MGYPSLEDETAILMGHGKNCSLEMVNPVITAQELLELQRETAEVYIHPSVCRYLVELSNATRNHQGISLGLSTRGTLAVSALAKAAAYMDGRDYVLPADGAAVFEDAAVHRLRLSAKAETEGGDPGALVRGILESVPMPRYVLPADGAAVFEDAAVHRLRLSAKAETEGGDPGALVRGILESVPMPRPEKTV